VQIDIFTAGVLCRASYRVLEYWTDTGRALTTWWSKTNVDLDHHSGV